MPRQRSNGELTVLRGKPYFRIRIDNERAVIPIVCTTQPAIEERAAVLQKTAMRLRKSGQFVLLKSLLEDAARAISPEELRAVLVVVDDICRKRVRVAPQLHKAMTFNELFPLWIDGTLLKLFPEHVRPLGPETAADYERWFRLYVQPIVGNLPIGTINDEHGLEILRSMPEDRSSSLRRNVTIVLTRPLRYAVFPCKVLDRFPFPKGFMPRKKNPRAKAFLYPEEEAQYLRCVEIPLPERLLVGLLTREGMRVEELTGADVKDFDRITRWFHLDENKSNDPRMWTMREDSAEALRRYLDHFHPNPVPDAPLLAQGDYIRTSGKRLVSRARATTLRANALTAGLIRPQLWENSGTRRHLTIHDLRATFITLSLAEGRTEAYITDRTGHKSSEMIYRYKRPARAYKEANLGPLLPLHEVIPELAALGRPKEGDATASEQADDGAPTEQSGEEASQPAPKGPETELGRSTSEEVERPTGRTEVPALFELPDAEETDMGTVPQLEPATSRDQIPAIFAIPEAPDSEKTVELAVPGIPDWAEDWAANYEGSQVPILINPIDLDGYEEPRKENKGLQRQDSNLGPGG